MVWTQPGQLAHVDTSNRLSIPLAVLRVVEWWKGQPAEVLVELAREGLVRVYLAQEAGPLVAALADALAVLSAEVRFERLAILADRYRPLKLYQDGRLQITKEIVQILGFNLGERPTLFVQAFPKGVEILSLAFRARRLETEFEATSIQLHTSGMG